MQAKHLQFVSGLNPVIYWMGNYVWDILNALIIVALSFTVIAAFQVDGYEGHYLGAVLCILVCLSTYINTLIERLLFLPSACHTQL